MSDTIDALDAFRTEVRKASGVSLICDITNMDALRIELHDGARSITRIVPLSSFAEYWHQYATLMIAEWKAKA